MYAEMSLLSIQSIDARHGLMRAVNNVSFDCEQGDILALVGANGAGKTTLLRTIAGVHTPHAGHILFDGIDITGLRAAARVHQGIAMVPEGRRLFGSMTVMDNLRVAGLRARPGSWDLDTVLDAFPQFKPKLRSPADQLSGGQQQAVSIARSLMTNPRLLLLDEISLGLSPIAVDQVYQSLQMLVTAGTTIILVEQDLGRALKFSRRVMCMLEGSIPLQGSTDDITREQILGAYFGLGHETAH